MKFSSIRQLLFIYLFLILTAPVEYARSEEENNLRVWKKRWEPTIQGFEKDFKENPPPENPILFVGASNFRMWDVKKFFPEYPVVNRAYGGSMLEESLYYFDRIVKPYEPSVIVLYAGANDMSRGKRSPEEVRDFYLTFVNRVHENFPKTRIIFLSLPLFHKFRDNPEKNEQFQKVNELILAETQKDDLLDFAEINKAMQGKDGKPREDLFKNDGIHVNDECYGIWAEAVKPFLKKSSAE